MNKNEVEMEEKEELVKRISRERKEKEKKEDVQGDEKWMLEERQ